MAGYYGLWQRGSDGLRLRWRPGGRWMPGLPTGTVTFLFTDIEGSTDLARRLGERWPEVLAEHHQILSDAIEGAGGDVVRTEGDAVFAAFASVKDAVGAAAVAQQMLSDHA